MVLYADYSTSQLVDEEGNVWCAAESEGWPTECDVCMRDVYAGYYCNELNIFICWRHVHVKVDREETVVAAQAAEAARQAGTVSQLRGTARPVQVLV